VKSEKKEWRLESWHEHQEKRAAEQADYLDRMEGISKDPQDEYQPALTLPHPPSPAMEGRKDDQGKARFDLLPPDALFEVVRVYTYGASKYNDRNWEKGIKWGRVFAAICRHCFAWWRGEREDQESGIHHLAHAAWGCLAVLAYELRGMGEFDDRR